MDSKIEQPAERISEETAKPERHSLPPIPGVPGRAGTGTNEEMPESSNRFDETMARFDAEALARLDAALQARRDNPNSPAPQSRWRDEVRDPFGMDWAWADLPEPRLDR